MAGHRQRGNFAEHWIHPKFMLWIIRCFKLSWGIFVSAHCLFSGSIFIARPALLTLLRYMSHSICRKRITLSNIVTTFCTSRFIYLYVVSLVWLTFWLMALMWKFSLSLILMREMAHPRFCEFIWLFEISQAKIRMITDVKSLKHDKYC